MSIKNAVRMSIFTIAEEDEDAANDYWDSSLRFNNQSYNKRICTDVKLSNNWARITLWFTIKGWGTKFTRYDDLKKKIHNLFVRMTI